LLYFEAAQVYGEIKYYQTLSIPSDERDVFKADKRDSIREKNCCQGNTEVHFGGCLRLWWVGGVRGLPDYDNAALAQLKSTALIRKLWQVAWDLWEHRNGFLHEADNNLVDQQVNEAIKTQFNLGYQDLDKQSQVLFSGGLKGMVNKPLDIRQQWLQRVQVARR
jgi:hypothetical protein